MKNRLPLIVLSTLLTMSLNLFAKDIVINNPVYEVTSSGINTITRIELSKENTKLHIHSQFLPNWWISFDKDLYIEDCDTNKKYYSTELIGTEYGKKTFMPASGDSTFIIVFPPLDKSTKAINFWSSDQTRIFNISLDPKAKQIDYDLIPNNVQEWLDAELTKAKNKEMIELESKEFFSDVPARLIGYIKGYNPKLGFSTGMLFLNNEVTREEMPTVIEIHPDGRFEANLKIKYPQIFYVSINKANPEFYIEPGQTLSVVLNWDEFLTADRYRNKPHRFIDIEFKGPLAKVNEDMLLAGNELPQLSFRDVYSEKAKGMLPMEYKAHQDEYVKPYEKGLQRLIDENKIGKKAGTILSLEFPIKKATFSFQYIGNYTNYGSDKNKVIPLEFYSFLQEIPSDDQRALIASCFSELINRLEYNDKFRPIYPEINKRNKRGVSLETFLFEELNVEKSKEDEEYLEINGKIKDEHGQIVINEQNKEDFELWKKLTTSYNERHKDAIEQYNEKYPAPTFTPRERIALAWHMQDSILVNELKIAPGFLSDIIKSRSIRHNISNVEEKEANSIIQSYELSVSTPYLKKEGLRLFEEKFSNDADLAYELPKGRGSEIIREIIAPFAGKYVLIDFWATWCGPCIQTIKKTKGVRESYTNHPELAFVFVSDDKVTEKYTEFVTEQELVNHHNISEDDFKHLRELFKFNGIPRYVLIDKSGKVLDDNFKGYNLEHELTKIFKEKVM